MLDISQQKAPAAGSREQVGAGLREPSSVDRQCGRRDAYKRKRGARAGGVDAAGECLDLGRREGCREQRRRRTLSCQGDVFAGLAPLVNEVGNGDGLDQ